MLLESLKVNVRRVLTCREIKCSFLGKSKRGSAGQVCCVVLQQYVYEVSYTCIRDATHHRVVHYTLPRDVERQITGTRLNIYRCGCSSNRKPTCTSRNSIHPAFSSPSLPTAHYPMTTPNSVHHHHHLQISTTRTQSSIAEHCPPFTFLIL
ncbi:hypothetical protein BDQ17DRAFT_548792 [Cyathus striatus]|nr:hypothetical protein BDQ17DRAFT_548792 [Cyathus striatus]